MKNYFKWTGRAIILLCVTIVPIVIMCFLYDLGWHAIFGPEEPLRGTMNYFAANFGGAMLILVIWIYPMVRIVKKLIDVWCEKLAVEERRLQDEWK